MASPNTTSLNSLPQEIYDIIFSHLLAFQNSSVAFRRLLAVRHTSRRLNHASQPQFFIQLCDRLKDVTFQFTFGSLGLLLRFTEVPELRDCIKSLTFVHGSLVPLECENRWSKERGTPLCKGHGPSPKDPMAWLEHHLCWEERRQNEEGSSIYHMLTQIFKNLKHARSMRRLDIKAGWEITLAAMEASGLDQDLNYVKKLWSGDKDPEEARRLFLDYLHHHAFRDRYDWHDVRNSSPPLEGILRRTLNIGVATVKGRSADMRHTWQALETSITKSPPKFIQPPHTLNLYDISIHIVPLKRYLRAQHITTRLDMLYVRLVAGSWRAVFKTMRKSSKPQYISLSHLYQKSKLPIQTQGKVGRRISCSENRVGLKGSSITSFLIAMCQAFGTRDIGREGWCEVELLNVKGDSYESAIDAPIRMKFRYKPLMPYTIEEEKPPALA